MPNLRKVGMQEMWGTYSLTTLSERLEAVRKDLRDYGAIDAESPINYEIVSIITEIKTFETEPAKKPAESPLR